MKQIKNLQRLPSLLEEKSNKLQLLPIKRRIRFNSYIQCENQTNFTSLINEDSIKNAKFNKIDWNCREFHQEIFDSCRNQIESEDKISQKRFSCESLPKIERIKRIKIGESPFKKRKIMRRLSYKKVFKK